MSTRIVYNGIEMLDVLTEDIDQDILYDGSNVDPVGVKVAVSVTARVHRAMTWLHGRWVGATTPIATGTAAIIQRLLAPRRQFSMWIGDQLLFNVKPGAAERCALPGTAVTNPMNFGQSDIDHGPRTKLKVLRVLGEQALHVQFQIHFVVPFCQEYDQFRGLLNLRWWIADEIDGKDWMTTRTYHGRLRVANAGISRHTIGRAYAIPPLQKGFRRESINLTEAPNGLELEFTIKDRQLYAAAPFPAVHWEGTFEIAIPYGGLTCEGEMRFKLYGQPNTPKSDLLQLAAKILQSRLHLDRLGARGKDGKLILITAGFVEDLENNRLSVHARVKYVYPDGKAVFLNLAGPDPNKELCEPLDAREVGFTSGGKTYAYDPQVAYTPQNDVLGQNLSGLFLCDLQTPCCPVWLSPDIPEYEPLAPPKKEEPPKPETASAGDPPVVAQKAPLEPWKGDLAADHLEFMYTQYTMTSSLRFEQNVCILPLAKADRSGMTTRKVDLGEPRSIREIRIVAERVDKVPDLPALKDNFIDENGITHWRVKTKIEPTASWMSADHRHDIFHVEATYEYALSRGIKEGDQIPVGNLPYRNEANNPFKGIDTRMLKDPKTIIDGKAGA